MRRTLAGVHGGALPTRAPCGGRMWLPPNRKDGPQAPPASVGAATCRGAKSHLRQPPRAQMPPHPAWVGGLKLVPSVPCVLDFGSPPAQV